MTRHTAADYLEQLGEKGFLEKHKSGRSNYFINTALVNLFMVRSGARVKICRPLPSLRSLRRPWQTPHYTAHSDAGRCSFDADG